ncbi:MAG: NUDIX domain-containing protein, partial [Planctomycetota bacterium]
MDFDELLILVDPHDRVVGHADKLTTHQDGGQLHRAFSVCVFNAGNEMLLQHRAASKYHFGGLWSNTCCGHPTGTNDTRSAAEKRLGEEFGFTTPLRSVVTFQYEAHDPM